VIQNENLNIGGVEKRIEQVLKKFKNTYIEIWNRNAEVIFSMEIPKNDKDAGPYLKELKEKLMENYIIPKNPKGGRFGFLGNIEIYAGPPPLANKTEKQKKRLRERLKKYIQEGRIDSTLEDVLKKVEENFEKHKERKILIVLKPDEEKVKEITRIIEEGGKSKEKIICILCSKKEYVCSPNEISKVFPWLVSPDKNITFVYNHSENKYHENLPICYKCAESLRGSKYLDIDFKFLDYNFRIFPEITIEDYNMVKNTWDYLTTKLGECFDDVVKELPSEKLKPEFIWLNIWIYRKEMNKLNIIDQIENIRLIDLIEMYRIFEAWREKKGIDEKIVDKNSLLNVIIQNEGKIQLHLDLALQILNKLLRKEKIDNNIQVRVLNIFNKLSQKYFHKENKKELQRFIKFVDFIEFYNKNLNI
jgi:hypothetical protein